MSWTFWKSSKLFAPITTLFVCFMSSRACFSLKNSGLKANLNGYFFSRLSVVPETAVDLIMIRGFTGEFMVTDRIVSIELWIGE